MSIDIFGNRARSNDVFGSGSSNIAFAPDTFNFNFGNTGSSQSSIFGKDLSRLSTDLSRLSTDKLKEE